MDKRAAKKRLTIGLLVDWVAEYHMKIAIGAMDAAKDHDMNLIVVEGGCVESFREYEAERNMLYQMAKMDELDGIIILSAGIGHFCDNKQLQEFVQGFKPTPIVCIAQEIPGTGFVGIDNSSGLIGLLEHLVDCHYYRRFALITGPKENRDTEFRLKIVLDTLDSYGVKLDECLIFPGDYSQSSGEKAVNTLFERGKADIDVIVAANDEMAFGAIEELKARGVRVPEDIAVVGFDNLEVSAFSSPPLTTINQSLYEQGRRALELVIEMINGEEPRTNYEATKLVIRESCGCYFQANQMKPLLRKEPREGDLNQIVMTNFMPIMKGVVDNWEMTVIGREHFNLSDIVKQLLEALKAQALNPKEADFLKTCHELIQKTATVDDDLLIWQTIISEIRRYIVPNFSDDMLTNIEDALHQARVMINEKTAERQRALYHESLQSNLVLNSINEVLYRKYNLHELIEVLVKKLPQMGITAFFLDQFVTEGKILGERQLLLAYNQTGRIEVDNQQAYSGCLVPKVYFSDEKPHALLVTLLQLTNIQFGLLGTEIDIRNFSIYGALRRIICSTLNGIVFDQEKRVIFEQEHFKRLSEMKHTMEEFVRTILLTVEMRDPYTAGHQSKVADLADAIATKMALSQEIVEGVRMAGIVHDLGKICVPAEILNKPGRLSPAEFALIKEHPKVAYDILKNLKFPWPLAEIILQHHERLNGSGYPYGLKDGDIRIEAKILAVADVIEAMASHRPYRPALGIEEAIREIEKNRGVLYDPDVVDACKKIF